MASNAQKTPYNKGIRLLTQDVARGVVHLLSKSAPVTVVSVSDNCLIVTVKFEVQSSYTFPQITCPVAFPEFQRVPIYEGMKGIVIPMDIYIGAMSGLGGGVASLTQNANLTNAVFWPIGNKGQDPSDNSQAYVIYGPDGAVIRDSGKTASMQVDGNGNQQVWGSKTSSFSAGGYGERWIDNGGGAVTHEIYDQGATVTTVHLPYSPPRIPGP